MQEHPIKQIRKALSASQEQFAHLIGVSLRTVSGIESMGENAGFRTIKAVSLKLRLSLDEAQAICSGSISKHNLNRILRRLAKQVKGAAV